MTPAAITRRRLLKTALLVTGAGAAAATAEFLGLPSGLLPGPDLRRPGGSGPPWPEAARILAETTVPAFPERNFTVTDSRYGAAGDGRTDDTAAIRSAIQDCSAQGGGHVVVPAGVYSTSALHLLSGVDLHLNRGAVLSFNGNAQGYPLVLTRYEGIECVNRSPMVYAYQQTGIALSGAGILDAGGTRAWNIGSDRAGVLEPLVAAGVPPQQRVVTARGRLRSAFVETYRCTNVLIQGVTLRRSQFWQLHPTLCRNVTVDGVTTGDTRNSNTDGCDPESCDHVVIKNCTLSANDDCIAIKSGRDADGRRVDTPSQDIVILACKLQGPAAGIALGSELTGGIRNVYAHDLETFGSGVRLMLYVKSNTRRGGSAQDIHLDTVRADRLGSAWASAQMDYDGQVGDHPPAFGRWSIRRARGDLLPVVFQLSGLEGDPISGVDVRDCRFTRVVLPVNLFRHVDHLEFSAVTINGHPA